MLSTDNIFECYTQADYERHRSYVLSVLRWRCRWLDPAEREALLHDAYVVFLDKRRRGLPTMQNMHESQIRLYLTRTALHKAYDQRKSARWRLCDPLEHAEQDESPDSIELPCPQPPIEERVVLRAEDDRLRSIIAALPEQRRRVIQLRFLFDLTPQEIQSRLGINKRTYRREIERGRRAVCEQFRAGCSVREIVSSLEAPA